ncbi:hypothetical protein [Pseudoxanthomonas sp. USHLN014]|uniref:hypothetical protein n=1 Tax=Pseudoxanthomonas sp. USHLN014 TaxID=3081297 RepID=UPI00301E4EFE
MSQTRPRGMPIPVERVFPLEVDLNAQVNLAIGRARYGKGLLSPQAVRESAWEQNDGSLLYLVEADGVAPQAFTYPAGQWRQLTDAELHALDVEAAESQATEDYPYDWRPEDER